MANGRIWTPQEVSRLYSYAETISQHEAARRLGRTRSAVSSKVRMLGIRWRQGYPNYTAIAREVGCSPSTVQRMARILLHDEVPHYGQEGTTSNRTILDFDTAERIKQVLKRTLKQRRQHVLAGIRGQELRRKRKR